MKQFRNIILAFVLAQVVVGLLYCASQRPRLAFNPGNVGLLLQHGHIRYWSLAWRDGFSKGRAFYLTQDPPDSPLITRHPGYRIIPSYTHRSYRAGCAPVATPWGPTL